MSFDHVMATAYAWTITLLYIYLCVWGLDLRLNNINYSCWYFSSSVNHHTLILNLSRLLTMDLTFIFHFSFYFILLCFSFIFLFLEQLGLGFISHTVTSVTNWWHSHQADHGTWENEAEGSGTKWRHTVWTTYVGLMLYSWSFRVGCTVASMDHG